ncbi:MAG: hypothetical protein B6I24_09090 [Bacteroidetes bacterium 4572_128]|nr:MAG: hypothetical protein B6I24_09090 [Bacteroidetes bacterium 4572_128]
MYKDFDKWDLDDLKKEFNILQSTDEDLMEKWFSMEKNISKEEFEKIKILRKILHRRVNAWNESELNFRFVAPLVYLVGLESITETIFLDRKIFKEINKKILGGEFDLAFGTGRYNPKEIYFCMHMHKRERGKVTNPLADLLITMFTIQLNNEEKHPVYGAYVVGRLWFFVVMDKQKYSVSKAFDTSKKQVFEAFSHLKNLKNLI